MEVMLVNKQELKDIIDASISAAIERITEKQAEKVVHTSTLIYGIKGLAAFLDVSMPTAQSWKNAGIFPYIQRGRTIIFKSDEVLAGLAKRKR